MKFSSSFDKSYEPGDKFLSNNEFSTSYNKAGLQEIC